MTASPTFKEYLPVHATIATAVSRKLVLPTALAAVFAVGALIAGCGGSSSLGKSDAVAVTVQKVTITNGQVERMAKFLGTTPDSTTGKATELPKPDSDAFWTLRADAAQQLRDQAVYAILASECGKPCAVSDKDVNTQIATIRSSSFDGSQAKLDATLKERGITLDDLKAIIRSTEQQQKLIERQQRGVTFTEAQAQAYYDKNIATYTTPATKELSHILVRTKAEALALRPKLTAANFAQTAKDVSLDADAKSTGGDLGPVASSGLIPELAIAATQLKPGVVSEPIETQFGWHLLIVLNVPKKITPFSDVKKQIIDEQLQAAKDAKVTKWQDGPVKKLQDAAVFANSRLAPAKETTATTTSSTGSTSSTGTAPTTTAK